VLACDRFTQELDSDEAERQRTQIRRMHRLASAGLCRHRAIARHLGEALADCGTSCDVCAGFDALAESGRVGDGRAGTAAAAAAIDRGPEVEDLFARLKVLRKQLASERRVPAYVIFNDATLLRIAERRPASDEALLAISGIGPAKLQLYGRALLEIVAGAPSSG
jgi:superfamily II DNA helicase RecQ